jgi:thioredoxin 1
MIAPKFKELAEKHPKINFIKVNVDDLVQTVVDWNVSAMPSFFLFKNGLKVDEVMGADEEKLKNMIENFEKTFMN